MDTSNKTLRNDRDFGQFPFRISQQAGVGYKLVLIATLFLLFLSPSHPPSTTNRRQPIKTVQKRFRLYDSTILLTHIPRRDASQN